MSTKKAQILAQKKEQLKERMRTILPPISESPIALPSCQVNEHPPAAKKIGLSEKVHEISLTESNTEEAEETRNEPEATVEEATKEHMDPLEIEENYQCGECGKMFLESMILKKHLDEVHIDQNQEKNKVVYLTPECRNCPKLEKDIELVKKVYTTSTQSHHEEIKEKVREIFNLERRNEHLKESADDLKIENKKYAKRVKDLIIENAKLHDNAKNDAEAIDDTISQNTVLIEELKVLKESKDADVILSEPEVRCKECDWKSNTASHLQGHMLKHKGQYICHKCKSAFKESTDLEAHDKENHKGNVKENENFKCVKCSRTFISNVALKQHNITKHKESLNPPVGHPDRVRSINSKGITCGDCGENFEGENEIKEHIKSKHKEEQRQGFQTVCKHLRNGFCRSGSQCKWSHIIEREYQDQTYRCMECDKKFFNKSQFKIHCQTHNDNVDFECKVCDIIFSTQKGIKEHMRQVHGQQSKVKPVCKFFLQGRCNRDVCEFNHLVEENTNTHTNSLVCRRGPSCYFKAQNRCFYHHPEVEISNHMNSKHKTKVCKYEDECWNISQCTFIHKVSKWDFQSNQRNKVHPNQRVNSVWQEY